jgi:D-serine deaminase-like pyridoxal phosphate-dependent protein
LAEWFRAVGVRKITVSSIEMATYFAENGWDDITVAFPVNVRAMTALNDLASRISLGILIADVSALPKLAAGLQHPVRAWIEVDTGYGRSGLPWDDPSALISAANAIVQVPQLNFAGILGHGGYTYNSHGLAEILAAHEKDIKRLDSAKSALLAAGFEDFEASTGDTPGCSRADNFGGADEIRPGNFVFYDIQQQQIGSCGFEQVAVALACPIVAIYPERNEVVIHGGGVHLGKDVLHKSAYGSIYGLVSMPTADGWEMPEMGCWMRSISQEHGVAVMRADLIPKLSVGDLILVLPVHSCMAADLMECLHIVDSDDPQHPVRMMKALKS